MTQPRYVQLPISAFRALDGQRINVKPETMYAKVSEICAKYRVSKYTIYEAIHNDMTFPVVNLGKRNYRIPEDKFERWLEEKSKRKSHIPSAEELLQEMLNAKSNN